MGDKAKTDKGRVELHLGMESSNPDNKVIVDGVDITRLVTGIEFESFAGDVARMRLHLLPRELWGTVYPHAVVMEIPSLDDFTSSEPRTALVRADDGPRPDRKV